MGSNCVFILSGAYLPTTWQKEKGREISYGSDGNNNMPLNTLLDIENINL